MFSLLKYFLSIASLGFTISRYEFTMQSKVSKVRCTAFGPIQADSENVLLNAFLEILKYVLGGTFFAFFFSCESTRGHCVRF